MLSMLTFALPWMAIQQYSTTASNICSGTCILPSVTACYVVFCQTLNPAGSIMAQSISMVRDLRVWLKVYIMLLLLYRILCSIQEL